MWRSASTPRHIKPTGIENKNYEWTSLSSVRMWFEETYNNNDMKNSSKTNWEKVDALTDDEIDTSDIPPLTDSFFTRAKWRKPVKPIAVTVHLDPEKTLMNFYYLSRWYFN